MNKKIAIFDGNHLAYRALYKFGNLRTIDGVKTGVIYGMVYVAESLIRRIGPDVAVVVFDGGRSKYRLELLPSYKDREKKIGFDADDFFRQKDAGKELFMTLGIKVAQKKHTEADDIIAMITRRYSKKEWDVVIVSGDKDFNQLIDGGWPGERGGIEIYNTSKGINYTYRNLCDKVGYYPAQTVDYLSLLGDKSDKIEGYPGIGPVKASQLLEQYGSVRNFLESGEKFGKVDNKKLEQIWKRNKKLIDLKFFYRKFLMKESIPWVNPTTGMCEDKLRKLCSTYEINSFLKPQFLKTFKNLSNE